MFRRDDVIESVWLIQKRRLIMGRRIFLGYTNLCWRKYEFAEYKMRFHGSFHASQNACLAVCLAVWVYVRVYVCLSVCVPICCLSTCLRVLSLCTAHLYVWISTMYVHVFRFMCSYRNAYTYRLFVCLFAYFLSFYTRIWIVYLVCVWVWFFYVSAWPSIHFSLCQRRHMCLLSVPVCTFISLSAYLLVSFSNIGRRWSSWSCWPFNAPMHSFVTRPFITDCLASNRRHPALVSIGYHAQTNRLFKPRAVITGDIGNNHFIRKKATLTNNMLHALHHIGEKVQYTKWV